jgi:ABC-2 type transport system permease protein
MTMTARAAARSVESPAHFRDLVAAEWIKLRSQRSTPWTFVVTALVVIGSAVMAARADYANFPHYSPAEQQAHGFSLSDAFPLASCMILMVVAASTGAAAIVSEYSSGLIRTTTVAVPARGSVVLAKAVVIAAAWTLAGAINSMASFAVSQAILHGRGADVSITHPGAFTALLGATLLAPVCALIGLGLGVLIRHSIATTVTAIVTLVMLPFYFSPQHRLTAEIRHAMVFTAWQRLTQAYGPPQIADSRAQAGQLLPGLYPPLGEAWLSYAAWPLVALLLALIVVRRRDV